MRPWLRPRPLGGALLGLGLALVACEAEPPPLPPTLAVGEPVSPGVLQSPGSSEAPAPRNSPDPKLLPGAGVAFPGLPVVQPSPSLAPGATPRPSPVPASPVASPTPPPPPGPGEVSAVVEAADGQRQAWPGALLEAGAEGTQTNLQGLAQVPRRSGADLVLWGQGLGTLVWAAWDGSPSTLKVQPLLPPGQPQAEGWWPVEGQVVDAEGLPVVRAVVEGGDGHGGLAGPWRTDAQGRFRGLARSLQVGTAQGFTLFATKRGGLGRIEGFAMAEGLSLGEGRPAVRLELQAPSSDLWPQWRVEDEQVEAEAWVEASNGARCVLRRWHREASLEPVQRVALPSDARLRFRWEEHDLEAQTWQGEQGPWPSGDRLAPQGLPVPGALGLSGSPLPTQAQWPGAAGAEAYALRAYGPTQPTPIWEGFTRQRQVTLARWPRQGQHRLELWALAGPLAQAGTWLGPGPEAPGLGGLPRADGRWGMRQGSWTGP